MKPLLDRLASSTLATSTYVLPEEDDLGGGVVDAAWDLAVRDREAGGAEDEEEPLATSDYALYQALNLLKGLRLLRPEV